MILELVTLACGWMYGGSGEDFSNKYKVPVWIQSHHGWYGLLFMLLSLAFWKKNKAFVWLFGLGFGLFFSDVIHHLIFAPIIYGNMRWHWP